MRLDPNSAVILDCEVYPNYFLVAFKGIGSGNTKSFEFTDTMPKADRKAVLDIMKNRTTVSFNGLNYDIPVIVAALMGRSSEAIHEISQYIISNNGRGWQTSNHFQLRQPEWPHIDIAEVAPGVRVGLKLYGARMHSQKLQDLPYDPMVRLTPEQQTDVKRYCVNDLDTTIDLWHRVKQDIDLRMEMNPAYASKSDAQIAEAVIRSELGIRKLQPHEPKLPIRYRPPEFIKFKTDPLNEVLAMLEAERFILSKTGSVQLPPSVAKTVIRLGDTDYQLGIGGLHSKDKKLVVIPKVHQQLLDNDVTAYYPSLILNLGLYPKQLGPRFLNVYQSLVNQRLEAKRSGNKYKDASLKIVINGAYGKLGSRWSVMYAPDLMLAVTLTGQLAILMLIERLELAGVSVVSANTDGFVSLIEDRELYDDICQQWQIDTGLTLEATPYDRLYARDVNNYLAVKPGGYKGKGIFNRDELRKNPVSWVSVEAVIAYLTDGTSIEDNVRHCRDLTKFLNVRRVTGGAVWQDQYLGKVVRWIYSTNGEHITYKNGNKVASSDGARPMMELEQHMPEDLDFDKYVETAYQILTTIGIENGYLEESL